MISSPSAVWHELPMIEEDSSDRDHQELSGAIFAEVNLIEQEQPYVLTRMRDAYKKYLGYEPAALIWGNGLNTFDRPHFKESRSLIRSGVDTSTALIAQHMPKATVQTHGAGMTLQRLATQLDNALVGAYHVSTLYAAAPQAFRDAAVCGNGHLGFTTVGKGRKFRVKVSRVFPAEVVVPERQCLNTPEDYTDRYRVTRVSRAAIEKKYKVTLKNDSAFSLIKRGSPGHNNVWQIEAIHIDGDDRRKVVAVPGHVLEDIEWPYPVFPYVDLWWSYPASGFYGDGIATRQFAKQARIDWLHTYLHGALQQHLKVLMANGPAGAPSVQQVGNNIDLVTGRSDPKFYQFPPPSPDARAEINSLFEAGMEEEGISVATAGNTLPPGLDSAPAQQEYSFKESQRFSDKAQRYERALAEQSAQLMILMYKTAAEQAGEGATLPFTGRDFASLVDWPDVDMEDDVFQIRIGASSLGSLTPAGRQQAVQNLLQTQQIGPVEARMLSAIPDLAHMDSLALAVRRYCEAFAEQLLEGELPAIDPDIDLIELEGVLLATYAKVATHDISNSTKETRLVAANIRDRLAELARMKAQRLQMAQQEANVAAAGSTAIAIANPSDSSGAGEPPGLPADAAGGDPAAILAALGQGPGPSQPQA